MPSKRSIKQRRHVIFYLSIIIFVGFFWVMPMAFNGPEPAEIIGEGLENIGETARTFKQMALDIMESADVTVAAIGSVTALAYTIYHIWKK